MARIEKNIFFLLFFSIPFQTRVFLFSADIVDGFNEWQSGFLYATDVILGMLFIVVGLRLLTEFLDSQVDSQNSKYEARNTKQYLNSNALMFKTRLGNLNFGHLNLFRISIFGFRIFKTTELFLFLFLIATLISIFFASQEIVAWYRWVKLVEFVGLFFYVGYIMRRGVRLESIAFWFVLSGVLQGVIAILQFVRQGSLGLKLLGEAPLAAGSAGVAHIYVEGERVMRAYGTFTNPNVLAAFLALSILFLFFLLFSRPLRDMRVKVFMLVSLLILVPALFITFSRIEIMIFYGLAVTYFAALVFLPRFKKYRALALSTFCVFFAVTVLTVTLLHAELFVRFIIASGPQTEALAERYLFNIIAVDLIQNNLGGVGIGNFIFEFRDLFPGLREALYQPVHNIFLLIAVESGVTAIIFFIFFITKVIGRGIRALFEEKNSEVVFFSLLATFYLLFTSLFDHFYLTLQQGALIFWIVFGLAYYTKRQIRDS